MYTTWTLVKLKTELRKRGAALSGKKADLIARLEAYDRNFDFDHIDYTGDTPQMSIPPTESFMDINASSCLPKIKMQHIQDYFDRFGKKTEDARKLYESRYLLIVRSCTIGSSTFIKGFCKAAMKQIQYEVNIKLADDGTPEEASCECAAGGGNEAHCKHVAVVLFGIENMAEQRHILLHEVSTQKLQTFHKPTKKFNASPIIASNLPSKRKVQNIVFSPYPIDAPFREDYNTKFRSLILNHPNSSMPLKTLYEPANPYGVLNDHDYEIDTPEDKILKALYLLDVSAEKIVEIEFLTRGQNSNSKWHELRCVHITASIFHTVCHMKETTMRTYSSQIIKKKNSKDQSNYTWHHSRTNSYCTL